MPSEVRFEVVRRLAEQHGWRLHRITGSHHVFKKPNGETHPPIPVHHGKVKNYYYRSLKTEVGVVD